MDNEILVHVKAPARIVDDRKYLTIAREVLNFQPRSIINITDLPNDPGGSSPVHEQDSDHWSAESSHNTAQSNVSFFTQQSPPSIKSRCRNSARTGGIRAPARITKAGFTWSRNNPPYKSPLRKTSRPIEVSSQRDDTTSSTSPTYTPGHNSRILVPDTEPRNRQRAWSDYIVTSTGNIAIVNSQQPVVDPEIRHMSDPSLSQNRTSTSTDASPSAIPMTLARLPIQTPTGRGIPDHPHNDGPAPDNDVAVARAKYDIKQSHRLLHGTPASELPLIPGSCSVDADISTATMTQQTIPKSCRDVNRVLTDLSAAKPSLIDLVTPSEDDAGRVECEDQQIQSSSIGLSLSGRGSSCHNATSFSSSTSAYALIQELPSVLNPPNAGLASVFNPAQTHPVLKATATALTIPDDFRPLEMTRLVKATERGYWKVDFNIAHHGQHQRPLHEASPIRQVSEQSTWRPLLKRGFLTEEEFVEVWNDLDAFVSSGNAGDSVRVVRRQFTKTHTGAQFYLQVYCYGVAIPYVYAMLLVCTRMYAVCQRLRWMSAVDEQSVLTMTGDERRKGTLGRWALCGGRQRNGLWGLQ